MINEEKDPNKLKLVQEVIHNQLRYLKENQEILKEQVESSNGQTITPLDVKNNESHYKRL